LGAKKYAWPQAILLDYFGTVVEEDDIPIDEICTKISEVSPLGVSVAQVGSFWGDGFRELCARSFGDTFQRQRELELISLQHVLKRFKCDLDARELSQVLYTYWERPEIFPESREVLTQCGIPICLVSNIDNADILSALSYNSLSFDYMVTSEDSRAYKPHAAIFRKALSLVGLSVSDVLHVGDSLNSDVSGAKEQGIPVLWVNRKRRVVSNRDLTPDYVSIDLKGLLDILGK